MTQHHPGHAPLNAAAKPSPSLLKAYQPRGYPPMSAEAWEARRTYLRQALAKLLNPTLPEPDPKLLAVGPHGPFTDIWASPEPTGGPMVVYFTVRNRDRGPRWCPPEVFLMLELLLAFGGGLSVNDNGKGWAYLRPWGGHHRHTLGRLQANARRGEVVRQDKRADHHNQHPQNFRKETVSARSGSKPQSLPARGREDAIATALLYWSRNRYRSGIVVSREDYEAILRDCFRLVDAYYAEDPADAEDDAVA